MICFSQRCLAWLLICLFVLPILLGLAGTVVLALGLVPGADSGHGFELLLKDPRVFPAIFLSLYTGIIATLLVLAITVLALVCAYGTRIWVWLSVTLPPILAVPHAALAVGLIFLIAPSGALVRLVSPALSGWSRPPTSWVVPDADGWVLIIALVLKEMPFLFLACAAQLSALNVDSSMQIGRTLGYSPARCWNRLILPQLYPRIRLTLMVILVYNLTVVDMALLLGSGSPPTLSVLLLTLINDAESRAVASAGALLLTGMVIVCFLVMWLAELIVTWVAAHRRTSGVRGRGLGLCRQLGQGVVVSLMFLCISSILILIVWSFTYRWRFPATYPSQWTLQNWLSRSDQIMQPAWSTVNIGLCVLLLTLASAIGWLELERLSVAPKMDAVWFLPLLIPQICLLFGWQTVVLWSGMDGHWWTVVHSHWLYTLPYVVLILAVAWREQDPLWGHAARSLGAGYWRVLWKIRIPLLRRPLCQAAAVAVAVSVAQYLPTLLLGAGRYQTLAIELVTSFGGVDRRVIATLAVLQSALPLLAFSLAMLYPRWRAVRLKNHSDRARHLQRAVL